MATSETPTLRGKTIHVSGMNRIVVQVEQTRESVNTLRQEQNISFANVYLESNRDSRKIVQEQHKVYSLFDKTTALEHKIYTHSAPVVHHEPKPIHQPKLIDREEHLIEDKGGKRRKSRGKHKSKNGDEHEGGGLLGVIGDLGGTLIGAGAALILPSIVSAKPIDGKQDSDQKYSSDTPNNSVAGQRSPTAPPPSSNPVAGDVNQASVTAPIPSPSTPVSMPLQPATPTSSMSVDVNTGRDAQTINDSYRSISGNASDSYAYSMKYLSNGALSRLQAYIDYLERKYNSKQFIVYNDIHPGVNGVTPSDRSYDPATDTTTFESGGKRIVLPGNYGYSQTPEYSGRRSGVSYPSPVTGGNGALEKSSSRNIGKGGTVNNNVPAVGRAFLDALAGGESKSYNDINYKAGGGKFVGYAHHPFEGQRGYTAAGRYQDVTSTWDSIARKYGLHDFSPASQDIGNWDHAKDVYRRKTGRDLQADLKDRRNWGYIAQSMQSEWTSLSPGTFSRRMAQASVNYKDNPDGTSQDVNSTRTASSGSTATPDGVNPPSSLVPITAANAKDAAGHAVDLAMSKLGEHERINRADIEQYLRTGGHGMDPVKVSWCAAFVGASLEQAGIKSIPAQRGGNIATSYLRWGDSVNDKSKAQRGDVLVENRGLSAGQTGGHLGMATGKVRMQDGRLQIQMVSGNFSNSVKTNWEDASEVSVRRADASDFRQPQVAQAPTPTPPASADPTAPSPEKPTVVASNTPSGKQESSVANDNGPTPMANAVNSYTQPKLAKPPKPPERAAAEPVKPARQQKRVARGAEDDINTSPHRRSVVFRDRDAPDDNEEINLPRYASGE